jgi:hypothetical protein
MTWDLTSQFANMIILQKSLSLMSVFIFLKRRDLGAGVAEWRAGCDG